MIRLFEYTDSTKYKDFEDYLFSQPEKLIFDFPADKITIDSIDYRLSSMTNLINETNGQDTQGTIRKVDFQSEVIGDNTTITVVPDKTKTIAFMNRGDTDIIVNNHNPILPNDSFIYGGDTDVITTEYIIEFSGSGIKNLIVITEIYL